VPVWALTPYGRSLVAPALPWLPAPPAKDVGARFLRAPSANASEAPKTTAPTVANDVQAPVGAECFEVPPARTDARTARSAASARNPTQGKVPASPGRIGSQAGESIALAEERNSHVVTPSASGVQARTAGELRGGSQVELPPVQIAQWT